MTMHNYNNNDKDEKVVINDWKLITAIVLLAIIAAHSLPSRFPSYVSLGFASVFRTTLITRYSLKKTTIDL